MSLKSLIKKKKKKASVWGSNLTLVTLKNVDTKASLVLQWVGLRAPNAGGAVSTPLGELDPAGHN